MADVGTREKTEATPFLRWAGGKRWLIAQLTDILGEYKVTNYHEPFLGGASLFFGLHPSGSRVYLSDLNKELIETYEQVRDHPYAVANHLSRHVNTSRHYYKIRDSESVEPSPAKRAANFIFLNHTSFNGIYRVNLAGGYNVPFGSRPSPNIPTRQHLKAISKRLKNVTLTSCDFEDAVTKVRRNDLVFLDPPYTVAHNHNGFVKYNQKLFSFDDQRRLARAIESIRRKGAFYILTNAAHSSIDDLFGSVDRKIELTRRNVIGGTSAARGTASEYMFTNLDKQ